jgi:hypothetical protein
MPPRSATFGCYREFKRARLVIRRVVPHIICYWHAGSLGADGEDYRAEYVHAPFPKISTQHHDCP